MSRVDPAWALTDDALKLVLHAEQDISLRVPVGESFIGMRPGQLGGTMTDEAWLRETATLRLISTVEAYVNAASEFLFSKKSIPPSKVSFRGRSVLNFYRREHQIKLEDCVGWTGVNAGIDFRNCLAHGLGNLTDLLISDQTLSIRMKEIDVTVSGNRMHPTATTIPKLAKACRAFLLDVEAQLVATL